MAAKSKKKRSTTQAKKKQAQQSFVRDEITIWLTLLVSILLMLSHFGLGGSAGAFVSSFFTGIFGLAAYVLPFVLFGVVAFLVSNKGSLAAYTKISAGMVLIVLTCTLLDLLDGKGGALGETVSELLTPVIGVAGTYVVVIILMIICFVIITGKSLIKGMKTQGDKAYGKAKEDSARRRKLAEERKKAREAERETAPRKRETTRTKKRTDKRVEGVSFNTTISEASPDVRELEDRPAEAEETAPQFVINRGETGTVEPAETPEGFDGIILNAGAFSHYSYGAEEARFSEEGFPGGLPEEKVPSGKKKKEPSPAEEAASVAAAVAAGAAKPKKAYRFPPMSLLKRGSKSTGESDAHLRETAMKLQQILQNFGVHVTVTNVSCGPSVTRYELQPEMGVKVSKIVGLTDDIKLNLAAADIRIEAPIPGKAAVGIEVPNKETSAVMLRDLLETQEFKSSQSNISFAAGKDIAGKAVVTDIAKMPHLLIAGATGSGKSVCINTLIMSILYKASPDEVKLIMIDPKVVELSVYNGIPHLMIPVVTDPKKAAGALNWAVAEMTRRYQAFAEYNVRDMKGYNEKVSAAPEIDGVKQLPMPQIVIIVDELADLMMVAPGDVEEAICRLAQLAAPVGQCHYGPDQSEHAVKNCIFCFLRCRLQDHH